jgi:two-component system cell cycle response regulator DivK
MVHFGCILPQHNRSAAPGPNHRVWLVITRAADRPRTCTLTSIPLVRNPYAMHTILVVEDDPDMRAIYRLALETASFAILEATSAGEALDLARARPPQLVVADLRLGSSSGADLCRALRHDPVLRAIPIVVVSGVTGEAARAAVRDAAPDAVLAKPLDLEEFTALCQALCRRAAATP